MAVRAITGFDEVSQVAVGQVFLDAKELRTCVELKLLATYDNKMWGRRRPAKVVLLPTLLTNDTLQCPSFCFVALTTKEEQQQLSFVEFHYSTIHVPRGTESTCCTMQYKSCRGQQKYCRTTNQYTQQ